jgi:hypothetical protein
MKNLKKIIIFIVLIGVAVLAFVLLQPKKAPEGVVSLVNTENQTANATDSVGADFLTLLLSVKNIKLEDSIFSDKAFMNLKDSSIVLIPDGTEGRTNPFAPLGQDAVSSTVNSLNSLPVNNATSTTSMTQELQSLIAPSNN